jgi:ionotropic glutamate receptor
MILCASYTANLVSFLTVEKPFSLVDSVQDLINPKPGVTYGAKSPGATLSFFNKANNSDYNKMFAYMNSSKTLPKNNTSGLELAKKGKYAFIMESSTIEYMTERHCEVIQIGQPLDEKGYGIAMKKSKKTLILVRSLFDYLQIHLFVGR